jgi:hypothetical protein
MGPPKRSLGQRMMQNQQNIARRGAALQRRQFLAAQAVAAGRRPSPVHDPDGLHPHEGPSSSSSHGPYAGGWTDPTGVPQPAGREPTVRRIRRRGPYVGEARGIQVAMEQGAVNTYRSLQVLSFRIERHDAMGDRLQPVSIRLRAPRIHGFVSDGDLVEVHGRRRRDGIVRVAKFRNLTAGCVVRGGGMGWRYVLLCTVIIAAMIGAFYGWDRVMGDKLGDAPLEQSAPEAVAGPTVRDPDIVATVGDSNDVVRDIQRSLRDRWGYSISVDGQYGPKTARAVTRFQKNHGLQPTGVVDRATFEAISAGPPADPVTPEPDATTAPVPANDAPPQPNQNGGRKPTEGEAPASSTVPVTNGTGESDVDQ